jgi:hypothetical protein
MEQGSSLHATILLKEASVPMQQMQIGHGVAPQENRKIDFHHLLNFCNSNIIRVDYAEVGVNLAPVRETSLALASYSVKAEPPVRLLNRHFWSESIKSTLY